MKKILIIVVSLLAICLTSLGIIGYFVEKDAQKNNASIEENIEEKKTPGIVLDVNSLDINNIEGYTPGGQASLQEDNEITGSDDTATENEESDASEESQNTKPQNEDDEKEEEVKVGNISLPFEVPYKDVEILSIGGYTGKFVEDGSDKSKTNTLAMVIKNTSDEIIDYGKIVFKIPGENNGAIFRFSNLKPGASALVLESTGKVTFNEDDKYIYLDSIINMGEEMSLMLDDINISAKEKEITVENLSENNLNTVYVYYKTVDKGGSYLGGITYRVKFEKVTAGKTISEKTIHFSPKNSEILMVESVKE